MSDTNTAFLISLLIIAAGYLIKRLNIIQENEAKVISKLVLYVTFPAVILDTVASLQITPSLIFLPLLPVAFSLILLVAASCTLKNKTHAMKGVVFMAVCGFNIGLFAYPIIEAIWGKSGLQHIAMFDLGNAVVILCISYALGFIYSPKRDISQEKVKVVTIIKLFVKSVPLVCYALAFLLNLLEIELPPIASSFIGTIASANMTLVLLLLGIYLNFDFKKSTLKPVFYILLARYTLGLIAGLILYHFLPFSDMYRTIALVALVLPIGLTIIPFSDEFGYDPTLPGVLANTTILVSFALMWGLILVFNLA